MTLAVSKKIKQKRARIFRKVRDRMLVSGNANVTSLLKRKEKM